MKIGGLYTYTDWRRLHKTKDLMEWVVDMPNKTPFVLLEVQEVSRTFGMTKSYKILTTNGDIGWIHGLKQCFRKLTP